MGPAAGSGIVYSFNPEKEPSLNNGSEEVTKKHEDVKDVVDILQCPKRTAQLQLLRLKKLKLIKQVGRGPASAYVQG